MDMKKGFIDFYRKLISINSVSSEIPEQDVSNEEVIDFLNSYLTGKGFITKKLSVRMPEISLILLQKSGKVMEAWPFAVILIRFRVTWQSGQVILLSLLKGITGYMGLA